MEPGEQRGPTAASYRLAEGEPTVPPDHTSPAAPSKYDSFAPPPVGSMALIDSPLPQLAPPSGREEISVSENTSIYVSFILITVYGMFIKCSPSCSLPIYQIFTDCLPLSSDLASLMFETSSSPPRHLDGSAFWGWGSSLGALAGRSEAELGPQVCSAACQRVRSSPPDLIRSDFHLTATWHRTQSKRD